jgi:hypothetical protein
MRFLSYFLEGRQVGEATSSGHMRKKQGRRLKRRPAVFS